MRGGACGRRRPVCVGTDWLCAKKTLATRRSMITNYRSNETRRCTDEPPTPAHVRTLLAELTTECLGPAIELLRPELEAYLLSLRRLVETVSHPHNFLGLMQEYEKDHMRLLFAIPLAGFHDALRALREQFERYDVERSGFIDDLRLAKNVVRAKVRAATEGRSGSAWFAVPRGRPRNRVLLIQK